MYKAFEIVATYLIYVLEIEHTSGVYILLVYRHTHTYIYTHYHIKSYSSVEIWEITKKVALSNNTISSAPHIALNSFNCDFNISTLGISEYTISDQAR